MPNLVALSLMVSDFQDVQYFSTFVAMANTVLEGIKFFQEIQKRTMAGSFLLNFIKIGWIVTENMYQIKVNAPMNKHIDTGWAPGHYRSKLGLGQ